MGFDQLVAVLHPPSSIRLLMLLGFPLLIKRNNVFAFIDSHLQKEAPIISFRVRQDVVQLLY